MRKRDLYATLIERCEAAAAKAAYFESSWYAYAVLEDRLRSLLRSSGGETKTVDGVEKTIRMMGPKLDALRGRAKTNHRLRAGLPVPRLRAWINTRNSLMHRMADGTIRIEEIDEQVQQLALEGVDLARECSASARRLKKHAVANPL
jgi:hypothetical protein